MKPERPVLRYFGGKWMLAPWIIANTPPHRIYCEPFGGGASVLLRKPRSRVEIYNDLDGEIVNVFRVMQRHPFRLKHLLSNTPFSRAEYDLSHEPSDDPVESARRCIVRSFQGHGADSLTGPHKSGFRANSSGSNRCGALDWAGYPEHLRTFADRLRGVVIENRDAMEVMRAQDSPETLFYVDPPYCTFTRKRKVAYRFEMTWQEHEELCEFLRTLTGMVLLSGYENPIYEDLGWTEKRYDTYADGAGERTEVLWLNPACVKASTQMNLFEALI